MAQDMSANRLGMPCCRSVRAAEDTTNQCVCHACPRWNSMTQEKMTIVRSRSPLLEVGRDRLPQCDWHWQRATASSLGAQDRHRSAPPIDIVERHGDDLADP